MKELLYLVFAVIPAIFWIYFFQKSDKGEKEPKRLLFIAFFMGALVVIPAAYLEIFLTKEAIPHLFFGADAAQAVYASYFILINFIVISLVEELFKFLAIRFSVYYSDYFNEISDGIIYMVVAAFGFAAFENFLYFVNFGPDIILPRSIFTPLFHASASAIIGHYLVETKFNRSYKRKIFEALLLASLIHFIYNLLVFSFGSTNEFIYMGGALVLLFLSTKWMFEKFRETEEIDEKCAMDEGEKC